MQRAISYINVMPEGEREINAFVNQVLSEVDNPLDLLTKLVSMELVIKGIRDGLITVGTGGDDPVHCPLCDCETREFICTYVEKVGYVCNQCVTRKCST